ncbi:WD40-like Beta Propeller Repeat [Formosa sp. Hel1_31_208]|uniref:PD40 domain-containing protein n=1 Tax=Formosa sp. Hel1_31_208 TaxID=1798225 RepID=UPI000879632B|nr:PD40 domain-containing protein [Formosa sp. Hel1_31_208]SDS33685.1 WD40-like Beta Propeller Repeat [Formosa sp. Hel1_31_208]
MKKYTLILMLALVVSCQKTTMTAHLSDHDILTPELFLPHIVTNEIDQEFGMTISPIDAKTILFTRRIGDEKQRIYETRYNNGQWNTPQIVSFSNDRDESPHFSKDGRTVYFGSERPIPNQTNLGGFDMNVWKTEWVNGAWTKPIPLSNTINKVQIEGENWPSSNVSHFVTSDDITFYTGTQVRGTKGLDIYQTTYDGADFKALKKLSSAINREDKWEYAPIISADGNYLFTQIYNREDGIGGDDIFVSKKDVEGKWMPSKNLGELINTNMNECPAAMTSDGKYFFFTRDKKDNPEEYDGISSIYIIETQALKLNELFK